MSRVTRGQVSEQTRILDNSIRNLRLRRQLEALEQDNFHDDPHANIVMAKNAPKFEDGEIFTGKRKRAARDLVGKASTAKEGGGVKRKRKSRIEIHKLRFRKNFLGLHDEFTQSLKKAGKDEARFGFMAYENATAPPPSAPPRKFCAVCGFTSGYNCVRCGTKYCSIRCRDVHNDTRCMKWTA